jgi:hypothetical protein
MGDFSVCNHVVTFFLLYITVELTLSGCTLSYCCFSGVHWLDFFDELLAPAMPAHVHVQVRGGGDALVVKLDPAFGLDGTHMNPSYLRLLEDRLNSLTGRK